jgi:sugar phosphate isomerase/epimerase
MNIAVSAAFWHNPRGGQFSTWLGQVAAIGYRGVVHFADFWVWTGGLEDPDAIRADLDARGMSLAALITSVHADFQRYRYLARQLARLDCRHLVCIGGTGHEDEDFRALGAILNHAGSIARDHGLRLSYHNHTDTSGDQYRHVVSLLRRTDPDLVSIDLDLGHALADFTDLPEPARVPRFLQEHPARLGLIEFKDWSPETGLDTTLGDGRCDLPAAATMLLDHGYADWIVIEQNNDTGRTWDERLNCAERSLRRLEQALDAARIPRSGGPGHG